MALQSKAKASCVGEKLGDPDSSRGTFLPTLLRAFRRITAPDQFRFPEAGMACPPTPARLALDE